MVQCRKCGAWWREHQESNPSSLKVLDRIIASRWHREVPSCQDIATQGGMIPTLCHQRRYPRAAVELGELVCVIDLHLHGPRTHIRWQRIDIRRQGRVKVGRHESTTPAKACSSEECDMMRRPVIVLSCPKLAQALDARRNAFFSQAAHHIATLHVVSLRAIDCPSSANTKRHEPVSEQSLKSESSV